MSQIMTSRRESIIFRAAWFLTIGLAFIYALTQTPSGTLRTVDMVLLLVMALLQFGMPKAGSPDWQFHAYFAVQGSLATTLLFLQPGWTMFPLLYFPLSVQAMLTFSWGPAIAWIAVFSLATAASFVYGMSWEEGLIGLVMYGGINLFFAGYATALKRADTARRESQALLEELQEAHRQLQEYALRAEELAVVEERNRLAREMHDTLGHRLTVASVQLEGAQRLCPTDPERAASMVGTVREQVREALGELRGTVATLRTPIEADLQLRSSLRRLVGHFEGATGLTVHRVLPDAIPDLPAEYRMALYRAAQEALTNVQRHAGASQVWLVLTAGDEAITLLVGDDGRGLTLSGEEMGFGLQGMRERAAQLGGALYVEPRRGGGTQLSFRLPLSGAEIAAEAAEKGSAGAGSLEEVHDG
jgi:signal transduction histidine kinase